MRRATRVLLFGHPPPKWSRPEDFFQQGDRVVLAPDVPRTAISRRIEVLMNLQEGVCAICGHGILLGAKLGGRTGATLDHVRPRNGAARRPERGNTLVVHGDCNSAKGNRAPTGCELIWLAAVTARESVRYDSARLADPREPATLAAVWPS